MLSFCIKHFLCFYQLDSTFFPQTFGESQRYLLSIYYCYYLMFCKFLQTRLEGVSEKKGGQFAVVLEVDIISYSPFFFKQFTSEQIFSQVQVFEVAPSLFMVDVRKASGDCLEYHKVSLLIILRQTRLCLMLLIFDNLNVPVLQFYKIFCSKLENIIWKPAEGSNLLRTMTC